MTTEFATLLSVVAGFLYQGWREWRKEKLQARQREWDREDRAELAAKVATTQRVTLAAIADNTAHTIEAKEQAQQAFVAGEKAYVEANNLTNKFIDVVAATKPSERP